MRPHTCHCSSGRNQMGDSWERDNSISAGMFSFVSLFTYSFINSTYVLMNWFLLRRRARITGQSKQCSAGGLFSAVLTVKWYEGAVGQSALASSVDSEEEKVMHFWGTRTRTSHFWWKPEKKKPPLAGCCLILTSPKSCVCATRKHRGYLVCGPLYPFTQGNLVQLLQQLSSCANIKQSTGAAITSMLQRFTELFNKQTL